MIKIKNLNEFHEVNIDLSNDKSLNDLEKLEFSNEIMKLFYQEKIKNFDNRAVIYYAEINDTVPLIKSYIKNVYNYSSGRFLKNLSGKETKVILYYNDDESYYLIFNLHGNNSFLYDDILNTEKENKLNGGEEID